MTKITRRLIAICFYALAVFCPSICSASDHRICFVEYSSVGQYDMFSQRKLRNETTDICFTQYSSVGQWDMFGQKKIRNETIDVCFVSSPSLGERDLMSRRLIRNPTLNVHISPRRTASTYNVTICSSPSTGDRSLGLGYGSYNPPTEDICFTEYSSVGQWDMFGQKKIRNATTDICLCEYSHVEEWDMFGQKKIRNGTTDIYLSPNSGTDTVDLYINRQVSRKQLVAILFKIGVLTKETSRGVSNASDKSFNAKVVDVHDGDTITVEDTFRNQVKVRLAKIDAPELNQDYGRESRKHLCDLIKGTTVRIEKTGKDDYGRILAIVYDDRDTEINLQMVKDGCAWHFKKYDQSYQYSQAEDNAKYMGKGLWMYGTPIPPWEWRKGGNRTY